MSQLSKKLSCLELDKARQIVILGNGPSIKNYIKYSKTINACVIGFNRVDRFLSDNDLNLDIYICVSDNVSNRDWGYEWTLSMSKAIMKSKISILSEEQLISLHHWKLWNDEFSTKIVLVDELLTEYPLYSAKAFPFKTNYNKSCEIQLSKTGTSVNVGYCIAASLRCKIIHLFGCDLGWKLTKGKMGTDLNHYFSDYQARISAPNIENIRMDFIHLNFSRQLSKEIKILNYSDKSMISYFEKIPSGLKGKEPSFSKYFRNRLILMFDECIRTAKRLLVKFMKKLGLK